MKFMKHALLATLLICQVADAQVYNYFPPPGITYTSAGGMALGSASVQGIGTLNAQGLYVNGTAVSTAIGANPTGTVGLSTVNGSASTFMRSDAAPSLSQTISPTMTGAWTFTPGSTVTAITANAASSSIGVKINGGAFQYGEIIQGQTGAGASNGLNIIAGTNSSDTAFAVANALNTVSYMTVLGSGSILAGNPTGSGEGVGTINSQGLYVNGSLVPYANASPTMTGNWTFTPSSGIAETINAHSANVGLLVNGVANAYAGEFQGVSTTGQSYGLLSAGGTNSADAAFDVVNYNNSLQLFRIAGDGGTLAGNPTGGDEGYGTINAQGLYVNGTAVVLPSGNVATATALATTPSQCTTAQFATGITANGTANCSSTLAGALTISSGGAAITGTTTVGGSQVLTLASGGNITTAPTINSNAIAVVTTGSFAPTFSSGFSSAPVGCNINWRLTGDVVTMVETTNCTNTSNTTDMTLNNLPAAITPAHVQVVPTIGCYTDNTGNSPDGAVTIQTNSTMNFLVMETNLVTNRVEESSTGFTNSGTKGLSIGCMWVYSKGN